jgi:hypothetical protein
MTAGIIRAASAPSAGRRMADIGPPASVLIAGAEAANTACIAFALIVLKHRESTILFVNVRTAISWDRGAWAWRRRLSRLYAGPHPAELKNEIRGWPEERDFPRLALLLCPGNFPLDKRDSHR